MSKWWKAAVFASLGLLAACASVTTNSPIGTTTGLGPDTALYGTWQGHFLGDKQKNYEKDFFVHFLKSGEKETNVLKVYAPGKSDEYASTDEYTITTAKLGDNHFFNAVRYQSDATEDTAHSNYIPVLYRLSGNRTLTLSLMDLDKTVAAIKAGVVEGSFSVRVRKDAQGRVESRYDYASIDAQPEALDAFMATPAAAGLFIEFMVLKKVD